MSLKLGATLGIELAGTGSAFPSDLGAGAVLSNRDVYRALLGPSAEAELENRGLSLDHAREIWGVDRREWIRGTSRERTESEVDVSALATKAARTAVGAAGLGAGELSLVIAATSTPARITSSLASLVAKRLGCGGDTACLDVRAGGTGGLYAWLTATRYLSRECPTALVVAAETPSLYIDERDLATAVVFGDGAAALVLRFTPERMTGLLGAALGRASSDGRAFTVPGPLPPDGAALANREYVFQRPDAEYRAALAAAWQAVGGDLRRGFPEHAASIAHFLPYAVTLPQVRQAAEALGVPLERTFHTLARHGCVGCAGPLVSLDALARDGKALPGQVVALAAVAGGISSAGLLWQL